MFAGMSTTDQQILDAAKTRLLAILNGGVAEFAEGNESAKLLEIDRLQKLIDGYEARVAQASTATFRPIRISRV